jgi:glycosyltransferase involved in cell wall biosynthesis
MSRRRCLLVEGLPYHWEVLPPWAGLLRRLGYDVEVVVAGGASGHEETRALLQSRCRTRRMADLGDLRLDDFDFVLVNSLIHQGFHFEPPLQPRPDLKWVRDLGLPSISVVHEPIYWVEKRIVQSFREASGRGDRLLSLLADGHLQYDGGAWAEERWSLSGNRLALSDGGRTRILESADGGRTYRGLDEETTLSRRDLPNEDLARHCSDGRHAVITLSKAGAAHLRPVHADADWILPFEIHDRLPQRATGDIAFAGTIDYDRKQIPALLQGGAALGDGRFIRIIGGSRSADFDGDRFVRAFKAQIAERGLESKFRFTGYLPYREFIERIRSCRFLLPLVDDRVDGGYYLIKLSASIAASFGMGVPMIVNRSIADRFDLHYMISYPGDDLAAGLQAEQRLGDTEYAAMLEALDRHAEALDRRNIDVLAGLIERITARHLEGVAT